MNPTPCLFAEIPHGLDDGHVYVLPPGAPLDESDVVKLGQRLRFAPVVVESNLISVSTDAAQLRGRRGRALLVLAQLDTAQLSSEHVETIKQQLLRRLERIDNLANDDSVKNARKGALIESPLLHVWSEHENFGALPGLPVRNRAPTPEPVTASRSTLPPRSAARVLPGVRRVLRASLTAVRDKLSRHRPIMAGLAAVALLGVLVSPWLGSRFRRSAPEDRQVAAHIALPKPPVAPAPALIPKAASVPVEARALAELRKSMSEALKSDAFNLRDKSCREQLGKTWPEVMIKWDEQANGATYKQYKELYRQVLERVLQNAAVDSSLISDAKIIDDDLISHKERGPFRTSTLSEDFDTWSRETRHILHEKLYKSILSKLKTSLGNASVGKEPYRPPVSWEALKSLAALVTTNPLPKLDGGPEARQRLERVAELVEALDASDVKVKLEFTMVVKKKAWPSTRFEYPEGQIEDMHPDSDYMDLIGGKRLMYGRYKLKDPFLSDPVVKVVKVELFQAKPNESSETTFTRTIQWSGRFSSVFDHEFKFQCIFDGGVIGDDARRASIASVPGAALLHGNWSGENKLGTSNSLTLMLSGSCLEVIPASGRSNSLPVKDRKTPPLRLLSDILEPKGARPIHVAPEIQH